MWVRCDSQPDVTVSRKACTHCVHRLPKPAYYFSEHLSRSKHNILSYFLEQIIATELFYKAIYSVFQKISWFLDSSATS